MFSFTQQEKTVLLFFAGVLLTGSLLAAILNRFPQLSSLNNLIESDQIYAKLDVNKANEQQLVDVPYIGVTTARSILAYRHEHGKFHALEELKQVKGIREKNYERFKKFFIVR